MITLLYIYESLSFIDFFFFWKSITLSSDVVSSKMPSNDFLTESEPSLNTCQVKEKKIMRKEK